MIKLVNENLTDEEIRQVVIRLMSEEIIHSNQFDKEKFIEKYGTKRASE
jgi:hypothetical protein